jgi:protein-disulfide isomerase/uncharacterized membrane protein YphA (DoxX/SURF4 family)
VTATGLTRWGVIRPYLALAVRLLLAGVWLYAGLSKIGDPGKFLVAVRAYQLLPDWLARAVAYGLPAFEIGLGVLLLAGLATRLAAAVSVAVLVVFTAGMVSAAARGLSIDCGCFGGGGAVSAGQTRYAQEIARDAGLLVAAACLTRWPATRWSVDERLAAVHAPAMRPGTARTRTAKARARVEQLLAREQQAARRRGRVATAAAAAALVVVTTVGIGVQAKRNAPANASPAVAYTGPVAKAGTGGIVVGYPDAKVTVDVYEDFMCPVCGLFETRSGADLLRLATDHKAKLAYHMLNFLDHASSGTQYSSRAANAAACAAAADQGLPFVRLHQLLYEHQPQESSTGLPDRTLVSYGLQAGATRDQFTSCVHDRTYLPWTNQLTETAFSKQGIQGTPTIRVAGQDIDWQHPQAIIDAVNRAAGT